MSTAGLRAISLSLSLSLSLPRQDAYIQCVVGMRNMYHKCRLVHGDLSEYNLLYMEGVLIFIDVSQASEVSFDPFIHLSPIHAIFHPPIRPLIHPSIHAPIHPHAAMT